LSFYIHKNRPNKNRENLTSSPLDRAISPNISKNPKFLVQKVRSRPDCGRLLWTVPKHIKFRNHFETRIMLSLYLIFSGYRTTGTCMEKNLTPR